MEEPQGCETFESAIRDLLAALIGRDEAMVIASENYANERCMLALEVSGIRVKFHLEFSAVSIFVGSKDSTPGWSAGMGDSRWWALPRVLDYLEGREKPTLAEVRSGSREWRSLGIRAALVKHVQRLEPMWKDVTHLFGGSAPQAEWARFTRFYDDRSALREEIFGN